MKLFKISQDLNNAYDTFDSVIVAANTAEEARRIHPGMLSWEEEASMVHGSWVRLPEQVKVEEIGEAKDGTPIGVVLASFNAG
jgi:hypothetical protein